MFCAILHKPACCFQFNCSAVRLPKSFLKSCVRRSIRVVQCRVSISKKGLILTVRKIQLITLQRLLLGHAIEDRMLYANPNRTRHKRKSLRAADRKSYYYAHREKAPRQTRISQEILLSQNDGRKRTAHIEDFGKHCVTILNHLYKTLNYFLAHVLESRPVSVYRIREMMLVLCTADRYTGPQKK